ncbi:hypothetical protein HDU76_007609, partial [Blyttiomyces sp. JEL0837]
MARAAHISTHASAYATTTTTTSNNSSSSPPASPKSPTVAVRSSYTFVDNELMDQLATFIDRHKAIEVTFVWMFMSLLNFWTDLANIGGWFLVTGMLTLRFTVWNPPVQAPLFMSPVAAHCTGFGLCYLLWKTAFVAYRNFDAISGFFGVALPDPPVITVREVADSHFKICWSASLMGVKGGGNNYGGGGGGWNTSGCKNKTGGDSGNNGDVAKHVMEVNGVVIGESAKEETCIVVMGLNPNTRYRVRVWAVAGKRTKTPSKSVLIKTLPPTAVAAKPIPPPAVKNEKENSADATSEDSVKPELVKSPIAQPSPPKPTEEQLREQAERRKQEERDLDNEMARLTTEIDLLRKQLGETERNLAETKEQYQREETELRDELAALRETKKMADAPRAELKIRMKQLDDAKRDVEARRARLEKD